MHAYILLHCKKSRSSGIPHVWHPIDAAQLAPVNDNLIPVSVEEQCVALGIYSISPCLLNWERTPFALYKTILRLLLLRFDNPIQTFAKMNKAFKEASAWMKPVVLNLTHTQKVQRLYRHSLKCMMSWAIDRHVINEEATKIRARFEANRNPSPDSPQARKLCREAEEELEVYPP